MTSLKNRTIAIIAPYFPPEGGGLERYAYEIANRLQKDFMWRVVVITSGERYGKDKKEEIGGLIVYRLGYRLKLSNTPLSLGWYGKIRSIISSENPDILNIHMPVLGIGDIAALLAASKPLIITYHACSMRKGRLLSDLPVWLYEHGILPFLLRRADRIVCSSDRIREEFLSGYLRKSVTITPAADCEVFKPDKEKRSKRPTVLFAAGLGRAEQHKGLKTLIDAIKILSEEVPGIRLLVVGNGDMKNKYKEHAYGLGLRDAVDFAGKLSGSELADSYKQAHVFALSTSNDSMPTTIIEAMACGLPVVSTLVGSIPALVEEGRTGYLIKPNESKLLAQKLAELFNNPEQASKFGESARIKAMKYFNWDERAVRYDELFDEILKARSKKHLHIVHVLAHFPPHLGGAEHRVRDLVARLALRNLDITVLTSNVGTPTGEQIENRVRINYLRSIYFAHTPLTPSLMWHLLRISKPSVIHLHVAQAFFPEIAALAAKLRGIPYIAHIRCTIIPSGVFGKFLPAYDRLILKPILRGAAKVIALTRDYQEIINKQYGVPFEKIEVIPNATVFRVLSRPHPAPGKTLRLLAVGRISLQKNYPFMLKVAQELKKTYGLDFTLKIVGPGSERKVLEEEARYLGIGDNVEFTGEKNGEELEKIYELSDILLHTSLIEGFGTVFIEAMAKGLPIIASDVAGTRSVIQNGRNGLLAELSVEKMSQAVMRIVNDAGLYEAISRNNISDVRLYDWEKITDKTIELYRVCKNYE